MTNQHTMDERRGWRFDDDERPPDEHDAHARWCGIAPSALRGLASLLADRDRRTWNLGDALIELYGPPPPAGILDGSRVRLERLATVLGCSVSWLTQLRLTAHAWPRDDRQRCSFDLHRELRAWPGRAGLLIEFLEHAERARQSATARMLAVWLTARADADPPASHGGRPRLDPMLRVERAALALDDDAVRVLIRRLTAALAERRQTVAA